MTLPRSGIVLHPFLFPIAGILGLLAQNVLRVPLPYAIASLAVWTIATALILAVGGLLFRDVSKLGAVLSLNYLHIFMASALPLVWEILLILGTVLASVFVMIFKGRLLRLTQGLNLVAVVMIVPPATTIVLDALTRWTPELSAQFRAEREVEPGTLQKLSNPPDIYYIVVDGYAGQGILQHLYHTSNDEFLSFLEARGFYIAEDARSNYAQTALSLASALNMNYVPGLYEELDPKSDDRRPMGALISDNWVFRLLRGQGYRIVTLPSGYSAAELRTPDVTIPVGWRLNQFEQKLLSGLSVVRLLRMLRLTDGDPQYPIHRERVRDALRLLPDAASQDRPSFVFAHIVSPHPPFVFGPGGEELTSDKPFPYADGVHWMGVHGKGSRVYRRLYRDQLLYLNQLLQESIEAILRRSSRPPVIILQADHGPGSVLVWNSPKATNHPERFSILLAHYWPGHSYEGLHPGITPINSFRAMFNKVFGATLELLHDRSYFSTWKRPYRFIDVTSVLAAHREERPPVQRVPHHAGSDAQPAINAN